MRDAGSIATSISYLVVEFEPELIDDQAFARYFDLKHALEELLQKSVDLVELSAMEDTRLRRIIDALQSPVLCSDALMFTSNSRCSQCGEYPSFWKIPH